MIVKTRPTSLSGVLPGARGVLKSRSLPSFVHERQAPSKDWAPWVAHFWRVSWDLPPGQVHEVQTLPHPNVHMVFEPEYAAIYGVSSKRFMKQLKGRGQSFGIKFRPGGLRPFFGRSVALLANTSCSIETVFSKCGELVKGLHHERVFASQVELATALLASEQPAFDAQLERVATLVERIAADRTFTSVQQVTRMSQWSLRVLQRIFAEYVGASPKWVINRFRIHEALAQIAGGVAENWTELALSLGYFDQSHFIRDFKRLVGQTPKAYATGISNSNEHS
jgi:AraC-like DNA-binding protein